MRPSRAGVPRALLGGWIVLLVLSGLSVGSALAAPAAIGTPARGAPPVRPAPGTCLLSATELTVVPCTTSHQAEVALAWTGELPDHPLNPAWYPPADYPPNFPASYCPSALSDHTGWTVRSEPRPGDRWRLQLGPLADVQVVHGPGDGYLPEWSWRACVVVVQDATRTPIDLDRPVGRASDGARAAVPDRWLSCEREVAPAVFQPVPCSEPHRWELLATGEVTLQHQEYQRLLELQNVSRPTGVVVAGPVPEAIQVRDPLVEQQCRSLVDTALDGSLGDHHDRLTVTVSMIVLRTTTSPDRSAVQDRAVVACSVQLLGDGNLVGSLIGLGAAPLPLG